MSLTLALVLLGLVVLVAGIFLATRNTPILNLLKRENVEVVTDLDAVLVRTVSFRYQGKSHEIKPLSFENFLHVTNALAEIDLLRQKEVLTEDELINAYAKIFGLVCPSIKRKHVENMSQTQVAALFNLVLSHIMGKPKFEEEKKSTVTPMGVSKGQAQGFSV